MSIFTYNLIMFTVFAANLCQGQDINANPLPIKVLEATEIAEVNPHITFALNKNTLWTLEEAKTKEFITPEHKYHFGVTDSTVWLKFQVSNQGSNIKKMFLELANPVINHMQVFQLDSPDPRITKTGSNVAYNKRKYPYRNHAALLILSPHETQDILVAVSSKNTMNLPLTLKSPELMANQQNQMNQLFGFYFGAIFLVATLAILMFLLQKQISYLYYLGLVSFLHITLIPYIFGINHAYILPNTDNIGFYVTSLGQIGTMNFFILFTHRLFQDDGLHLPRYTRTMVATIGILYSIYVLFFGPSTLHLFILPVTEASIIIITLIAAIKGVRQRSITALLFLLSWASMFSAALPWIATIFGLIGVKTAGMIAILACLFQAVILLATMAQNVKQLQENKIAANKYINKIRALLDNINQGIITFNESLCIDPEFSAFLGKFYKTPPGSIPGQDVLQFTFPDSDLSANDYNQAHQALRFLAGEKAISWEMNKTRLPRGAKIRIEGLEKYITLSWSPMVNDEGIIESLMLSIKDVTKQRRLEAESRSQIEKNKQFMSIISELIVHKRSHVNEYLTDARYRINTVISEVEADADPAKILMELHTIKGGARLLHAKSLSNLAHSAEDAAKELGNRGENTKEEIIAKMYDLKKELVKYSNVFTEALYKGPEKSNLNDIETLQGIIAPCLDAVLQKLNKTRLRLKTVNCDDRVNSWNPSIVPDSRNMLMHGINNSIDHGYLQSDNLKVGFEGIKLWISAHRESNDIVIQLEDNGQGIDLQKIKDVAHKKGIYFGKNEESVVETLFTPGLSTAKKLTPTSGRGIGLSAVREIAQKIGGTVRLKRRSQQGANLIIVLPARAAVAQTPFVNKRKLVAS